MSMGWVDGVGYARRTLTVAKDVDTDMKDDLTSFINQALRPEEQQIKEEALGEDAENLT